MGRRGRNADAVGMKPLRRILHVDDQPEIRSVVGLALGKLGGYALLACNSGEQAIEVAPGFSPDLLLLDVNMPALDGFATLERLRAIGVLAPAIFFTSRAGAEDVARYREAGALGSIPKPFDPLKLGRQILRLWNAGYPSGG